MAELDVAGTLALERAQSLVAGVETAETRLAEARERFARSRAEAESEWSRLSAQAAEVATEIGAETQELLAEGAHAQEALVQLRGTYERLGSEAGGEKERIEEELEALAGRLREIDPALEKGLAEVDQHVDQLMATCQSLEAQREQMEAELFAALGDGLATDLHQLEDAIRQRTDALAAFLDAEAIPMVNAAVEELLAHLQVAEASVREALEVAGQAVAEAAERAVDEVAVGHEEALTDLAGLGGALEDLLHKLNALTERGGAAVRRDRETLNEGAREAQESLSAALGLVKDVEETLRRYSFVHF